MQSICPNKGVGWVGVVAHVAHFFRSEFNFDLGWGLSTAGRTVPGDTDCTFCRALIRNLCSSTILDSQLRRNGIVHPDCNRTPGSIFFNSQL